MSGSVGFTGSRELEAWQRLAIDDELGRLAAADPPSRIVTGGCTGVDAYVARRAHALGLHVHTVLPANRGRIDPDWRAHCSTYEQMPQGTDYRARNQRLVALADELVAVPRFAEDNPRSYRSGTWQTVRIARGLGRSVRVRRQP